MLGLSSWVNGGSVNWDRGGLDEEWVRERRVEDERCQGYEDIWTRDTH